MVKEYSISEILSDNVRNHDFAAGVFEDTEDPEIEWPHRHSYYSMVWFTKGSGSNVIDFTEHEILENRLFMVGPKQIHNWAYSKDCRGFFLVFESHVAAKLSIEFSIPFVDIDTANEPLVRNVFTNLLIEEERNDALSHKNVETGLCYLCSIVNRIASSQADSTFQDNGNAMHLFKAAIVNNFATMKSVDQYAVQLKIDAVELNKSCQRSTGVSAKQYILDVRITEAKRLLLYTALTISEIAFDLGFEDASYFSRIFKKKTSFSPSEFIEKYRK